MTDMASWLASLDEARLELVLSRRPDSTAGLIPRNLGQLAQRLGHPQCVAAVLDAAPTPLLQVSEALLVLGPLRTEAALRDLLRHHQPDHDAAVTATLERLYDIAIAWPGDDGTIGLAPGLAQLFPRPLGLGPPLSAVLERMSGNTLTRALKILGEAKPPTRRDDAAAALRLRLTDAAGVRAIVAAAPASIARQLHAIAGNGLSRTKPARGVGDADQFGLDTGPVLDGYSDDGGALAGRGFGSNVLDGYPVDGGGIDGIDRDQPYAIGYPLDDALDDPVDFRGFDYARYAQRYEAEDWAIERGLMSGSTFGGATFMPAEIAVALRGTAYAPFDPYPPPIPSTAIDPAGVESGAAAAATDFAGQAVAVLDLIARAPLPQLKSGGVGARELARVAKSAGIEESAVRLVVEVAAQLGLVAMDRGFLQATTAYPSWRELEPSAAYARLLDMWLAMPFTPTEATDGEGRAIRLLQRNGSPHDAVAARDVLLTVLASLPRGRGTTRAGAAPALVWSRPRVGPLPQHADTPYAGVWAEAERLGVIAAGALSGIGYAIDGRDGDGLDRLLRAMLPASTDAARFGSDLTVLVSGSPSARVSSLLDRAADRESRGAGVTWRFSPASVRRALDEGADPAGLLTALEAIAIGQLPHPLRYLVNDVARRHGELQVSPAVTIIRGEDTALLAQVAADRGLRGLGLRLVAPTVLTGTKPASDTLLALRAAGYLPVPEPRDQSSAIAPSTSLSGLQRPPRPPARSPAGLAEQGLTGPKSGRPKAPAVVSLRALAAHLLATSAIDHAAAVAGAATVTGAPAVAGAPGDSGVVGGAGAVGNGTAATTEQVLGALNFRLNADEIHQLAYAVETGGPVSITYESTSGARTRRVIDDATLAGGMLDAWCYLRDAERYFLVDRIISVTPGSP